MQTCMLPQAITIPYSLHSGPADPRERHRRTRWSRSWLHRPVTAPPSTPTARLIPMDPAILAIPTSGRVHTGTQECRVQL